MLVKTGKRRLLCLPASRPVCLINLKLLFACVGPDVRSLAFPIATRLWTRRLLQGLSDDGNGLHTCIRACYGGQPLTCSQP